MTDEPTTVSGTVAEVTPWKSKKGNWVNFKDNPNDFFAYASKSPKVGDTGTWQAKAGTGIFTDKVELVKLVKKDGEKPEDAEKPLEEAETGKKVYLTQQEAESTRQNLIVEQCCLKAAATVVSGVWPKGKPAHWGVIADRVLYVKDRFYNDLLGVNERQIELGDPEDEPEAGE